MKLTEAQRTELFEAMMVPPTPGPRESLKELEEIVAEDVERIAPIIERWLDERPA